MAVVKGLLKGIAGFPPEIELLGCDYSLNRHTDQLGKPTSEPNGGTISLVFQSLAQACWDWMVNSEMKPEGTIEFVDSEKKFSKPSPLRMPTASTMVKALAWVVIQNHWSLVANRWISEKIHLKTLGVV